ncbi:uncharacterized protein LOC117242725 [Bombus vosnesenskii]|uniref:Uncharacterized protein LOC117242725 n=1 Tax=Bombus vosnesenskii TaxID=207650 RepID=A0A6J3LJF7_9HYME|nr:uncharacterized protein LOC117242725 [Bombus vosnesenskii]
MCLGKKWVERVRVEFIVVVRRSLCRCVEEVASNENVKRGGDAATAIKRMYFASKGLENLMKFMAHLTQVSACSSRSHVSVVLKTENFQSNATKGREKGRRK